MKDPKRQRQPSLGGGSGNEPAPDPVAKRIGKPASRTGIAAQIRPLTAQRVAAKPEPAMGSLAPGAQPAPTTRRLFPEEVRQAGTLADRFDAAKARGDFLAMRSIGQTLKDSYGYEYGVGDGGWPYIKPPTSDVVPIDDSAGTRVRKEAVARQIAQDRAEQEERAYAAAHDNRGAIRRGAGGFFDALKAKLGDLEAGIGRGLDSVETAVDYYSPEAVAARLVHRPGPPSEPAISAREANWGQQLKQRGEDIAAAARHHQDVYGQDLASQTGAVLGDVTANVGAGMLGGPYGVGILDATAAYGRGQPLAQALGTGVISAASLEAGGRLGGALKEAFAASPLTSYFGRAGEPVARYLGRSAGYAVGPQAVSIPGTALVYGKPEIPDGAKEIALNIAQALGFGFLPGRRDALKFIAQHPDTAPSVGAALKGILSGEIEPRGAPEPSANASVSPGVVSENAGMMRGGAWKRQATREALPLREKAFDPESSERLGKDPASVQGQPLREGDVMTYGEYRELRDPGSDFRGHHTPQAQRLRQLGIHPNKGTVVVMLHKKLGPSGERIGHTVTRTHGRAGARTAEAEKDKPLSFSEALDLEDPPVKALGPEVAQRIRAHNRKKFPVHFRVDQ